MKTFGHIRRDPQQGKNGFSKFMGYTIIELMVVITVVGIITSFALPSYRIIIEKRQVTSAAEQLAAFLSAGQMEAVKRNENITFTYSMTDSDTWCLGATSGVTACDCTQTDPTESDACVIDAQMRVFSDADLNFPDLMDGMQGDGFFTYDPVRGLMVDHTDNATLELLSREDRYALNVQLGATGRLKICSKDSSSKVPGYDLC